MFKKFMILVSVICLFATVCVIVASISVINIFDMDIFGYESKLEIAKIENQTELDIALDTNRTHLEIAELDAKTQRHISDNERSIQQYKTSTMPINILLVTVGLVLITIIIFLGKEILNALLRSSI